jgi:hypothetical protein
MNSFSNKKISKSHITEQRFNPYSKARNYIKHLNTIYDLKQDKDLYDESYRLTQVFQHKTPVNDNHRLSLLPKSAVSSEIQHKIKILNVFHNLSERKMKKIISKTNQFLLLLKEFVMTILMPKNTQNC